MCSSDLARSRDRLAVLALARPQKSWLWWEREHCRCVRHHSEATASAQPFVAAQGTLQHRVQPVLKSAHCEELLGMSSAKRKATRPVLWLTSNASASTLSSVVASTVVAVEPVAGRLIECATAEVYDSWDSLPTAIV